MFFESQPNPNCITVPHDFEWLLVKLIKLRKKKIKKTVVVILKQVLEKSFSVTYFSFVLLKLGRKCMKLQLQMFDGIQMVLIMKNKCALQTTAYYWYQVFVTNEILEMKVVTRIGFWIIKQSRNWLEYPKKQLLQYLRNQHIHNF